MAVPKKRRSKSKKRIKCAAWRASIIKPETTTCTQCGVTIRNHCTCYACGYYQGSPVLRIKSNR